MKFDTVTLGSFTANGTNTQFTYSGSTKVIDISLFFNVTANDAANYFNFKLYVGLTLAADVTINDTYGFADLSVNSITINNNDIVKVVIDTTSTNYEFFGGGEFKIDLQTPESVPIDYNEMLYMNNMLPVGIFQRDFFVSMLKMFNLMVTEDKYKEKHLIIKPYKDFYDGTQVDWSDKIDRSKAIRQKPMSEVNARYYNFKYKQDVDFYNENYFKKFNEGYGDRLYDNEFDFAKDTETNELIFASTVIVKTSANDKVYPALFKRSNANTAKDKMASVIRIMQAQKITSVSGWHIRKEGSGNLSPTLTSYGYAGHLYFGGGSLSTPTVDINFGAPKELQFQPTSYPSDNLFNTYYSPYMAEITNKDSRLLTAYFKLNDIDIFNLDFAKFVYVDGGLYRLIKVYDYTPESNEVTKVDLLRVINKTY